MNFFYTKLFFERQKDAAKNIIENILLTDAKTYVEKFYKSIGHQSCFLIGRRTCRHFDASQFQASQLIKLSLSIPGVFKN